MANETVITVIGERFWAKVNKKGPQPATFRNRGACWEWTAGLINTGYGLFHPSHGKNVLAHRFAYELLVGPIPDGLVVDHLCRNRTCVNPAHLEPVTQAENMRRGLGVSVFNARKTYCPAGHPYSPQNTYREPSGGRRCRECARESDRRRSPGPRRVVDIDIEKVRQLYAAGHGATRIRAELGVGLPRLYRAMDHAGIPRRTSGRVRKGA